MERIMEPGEVYSEKKIAQLLEYATENLEPGAGYKLKLEGVQTDKVTRNELDAFFGVEIDHDEGARIDLAYSEQHNGLVLDQLSFPVRNAIMSAELRRTESGIYIPLITTSESTYPKDQQYMSETMVEQFLERFGLRDIPRNDSTDYRLWQANILASTRAWSLREEMEIPLAITSDSVQMVTLSKDTIVNQQNFDILTNILLKEQIVAYYDQNDQKDFSESSLELITDAASQKLRHFVASYTETYDPFVINNTATSNMRLTDVPISEENFSDITRRIEQVIAAQHEAKQI